MFRWLRVWWRRRRMSSEWLDSQCLRDGKRGWTDGPVWRFPKGDK